MRRIRALGKNRIASSSSIKCSVSRVWPLVGTFTKQSSSDQYFSSFGCKRTKSLACARLCTGNAVCKVSTSPIVGFCLDLNLFRSNASGLAIGVVASSIGVVTSSPFSSGTSLSSGFFVASSDMVSSLSLRGYIKRGRRFARPAPFGSRLLTDQPARADRHLARAKAHGPHFEVHRFRNVVIPAKLADRIGCWRATDPRGAIVHMRHGLAERRRLLLAAVLVGGGVGLLLAACLVVGSGLVVSLVLGSFGVPGTALRTRGGHSRLAAGQFGAVGGHRSRSQFAVAKHHHGASLGTIRLP